MGEQSMTVSLREVDNSDLEFLYSLLEERDPCANISHKKMPTFEEHVKFVQSKPYFVWYVILANKERVGSIYLSKQNEIGIFVKKYMKGMGIGSQALKLLVKQNPRRRYLANISPQNHVSSKFFKKHNFKLIQYTYELIDDGIEYN